MGVKWIYENSYNGGNCTLILFTEGDTLTVEVEDYNCGSLHGLNRAEAIEAAKAILKHYGVTL